MSLHFNQVKFLNENKNLLIPLYEVFTDSLQYKKNVLYIPSKNDLHLIKTNPLFSFLRRRKKSIEEAKKDLLILNESYLNIGIATISKLSNCNSSFLK